MRAGSPFWRRLPIQWRLQLIVQLPLLAFFLSANTQGTLPQRIAGWAAGGGLAFQAAVFVVIAWFVQHNITLPVTRLRRVIERISESADLSERADVSGSPNMNGLAATFNRLLEALQGKTEESRLLARVVDSSAEAVVITDEKARILYVNGAFTAITGYARHEVVGCDPGIMKSDRHGRAFYREMWRDLGRKGSWQGEIWNRRKNGEVFPEWLSLSCVRNARGEITHFFGLFHDLSAQKEAWAKIEHLANFDSLTGLANRNLLDDRLARMLERAARGREKVSIIFMDLDDFKHINDSMGHDAGDVLLRLIAERLKGCVKDGDMIARQGGDEFTIAIGRLGSVEEIDAIAERMIAAVSQPYSINDREVYVSASVGISFYPDDGEDKRTLFKCADAAMYSAKTAGKNKFRRYTPGLNQAAQEKLSIQNGLHTALRDDEFELHYQPQLSLATGKIHGVEALLRWNSGETGYVPPGRFIPIAEESDLIVRIGYWAIRKAFCDLRAIRDAGFDLGMSVNVSGRQFLESDFVELLRDVAAANDVLPEHIELEITETVLMSQQEKIRRMLERISGLGFTLALDDFGTGYSSLSYLKSFPIDRIKIDQSFVRNVTTDPEDKAIVDAIIAMARGLGVNVIAEGVETADQLDHLSRRDCPDIQGYLISRPVPLPQLVQFLRDRNAARELPQPGWKKEITSALSGARPK